MAKLKYTSSRVTSRYRPGDYETWKYIAPVQKAALVAQDLRTRHLGR